jgi:hypothetical protein
MAEDDPAEIYSVHRKENLIKHQEHIMAIKDAIKPGFIALYFKEFKIQMLKDYFNRIVDDN